MKLEQYISNFNDTASTYWNEIKLICYGSFALLNIDIDVVKVLIALMVIDTFLGAIKSIIVYKYHFTFKKLLWGVVTKCLILLVPMILALVALGLGYDFRFVVDIILKILIVSEAISSITNILSIKEKKPIENTDFISKTLHIIRRFLTNKLENFVSSLEDITQSKDDEDTNR